MELPEGYSKNEIARAEDGNFLTVNVSMSIVSFLEVDEIGQTLKVVFELRRSWFDARLTLLHLQKDQDLIVGKSGIPESRIPKIFGQN